MSRLPLTSAIPPSSGPPQKAPLTGTTADIIYFQFRFPFVLRRKSRTHHENPPFLVSHGDRRTDLFVIFRLLFFMDG